MDLSVTVVYFLML